MPVAAVTSGSGIFILGMERRTIRTTATISADVVFDDREFHRRQSNAGDRPGNYLPTALNRRAHCDDKAEGLSYALNLEGRRNRSKRCGIPDNMQV